MRCIKSAYGNHGPDSREAANPWEFSRDGARIKNTLTLLPFLLPISASIPCALCVLSHVQIFATPWTVACQAPLCMGFPRQEQDSWSGLPFSPGDAPNPGIKPVFPALAGEFFTAEPPCGSFHIKAAKYTFKCTWNIFQDRSLLGHKINLRKLKKLYQASFFYHNSMKRNKLQEKTAKNQTHMLFA